jgi:hypothetical protein
MAKSPQVLDLKVASDELREIRVRFAPIHDHYFPQSWLLSLKRSLRLASQPDYARFLSELREMGDGARRIIDEAKATLESIPKEKVSRQFRQLADLTYRQIYLDGSAVVAMYEFVKAKNENDPASAKLAIEVDEFLHKAQENSARMRTWRLDLEESTLDPAAWDTQTPR